MVFWAKETIQSTTQETTQFSHSKLEKKDLHDTNTISQLLKLHFNKKN